MRWGKCKANYYTDCSEQARPSDPHLFRSRADPFARGANLKLRQANARAQAKVARACARVCQGLATPLCSLALFPDVQKWSYVWLCASKGACLFQLRSQKLVAARHSSNSPGMSLYLSVYQNPQPIMVTHLLMHLLHVGPCFVISNRLTFHKHARTGIEFHVNTSLK